MPTDIGRGSRIDNGSSIGLAFPVLVVLSVLVLVVPVPPMLLDLLLAANVTASVLILLTTISVRRPLDFSSFPSLLLVTTLVRLVLNVASTRLILTRAHIAGTDAAGTVIEVFGQFVAQGQLLVGLILFAIVVVIQFVVVTKGATRISEVAARFALDGLPGKQMAIDADVAAGSLTQEDAKKRREELVDQADFHAAMDGAGKFVRGDAIAGILITLINLFGGVAIGVLQHNMSAVKAVEVFATLTIGDGLVSQIPSVLISIAAALLATRSSRDTNLSQDVVEQTFHDPSALFLAAAFVAVLAFTGLPLLPLLALGIGCAVVGMTLTNRRKIAAVAKAAHSGSPGGPADAKSKVPTATPVMGRLSREIRPEDKLTIEPIVVELGFRLIKLADPESGGDLMERVTQLRSKIAQELGIILPKVKIRDNLRLKDYQYQIKLRDVTIAMGELKTDGMLAIDTGAVSGELLGVGFIEPATGRPAKWIDSSSTERAKILGYKVVEPAVVLISHLSEIVRTHAAELLTRQQLHHLLDHLRQTAPRVVDELIPDLLKPAHVHQILCNLLRERIPVRDLETILETLADQADRTKDVTLLTESARRVLNRTICQQYRDSSQTIVALTLDPALEDVLAAGFDLEERGVVIKLTPQVIEGVTQELLRQSTKLIRSGRPAIVVCSARVRPVIKQMSRTTIPGLVVLSLDEITRDTIVQSKGQIPLNAIKVFSKSVFEVSAPRIIATSIA